jgi:multidrug resistance protein MdtO
VSNTEASLCRLPATSAHGFWGFLKDELQPYPGRLSTVVRMVLAATLTMLVIMTLRSPNGAVGIFFSLNISRENPASTIRHGLQTLVAIVLGLIYVLVGVTIFINDSLGHLIFIALSLAIMFFVTRTFKNYSAALGFCFIVVSCLPVWDLPFPVDANVDNNIWLVFSVMLSICITVAVELLFCPRQTEVEEIQKGLDYCLDAVQSLLQLYLEERPVQNVPEAELVKQLARLGTSRFRRFLARSDMDDQSGLQEAEWGTLISVTERLVDTASNLGTPQAPLTHQDKDRLGALQAAIENIRTSIMAAQWPECLGWQFRLKASRALPLLPEMERKLVLLPRLPQKIELPENRFNLKDFNWRQLFLADAFSNADYLHFSVRGMFTGLCCYLFFSSVDWHGLGSSLTTCVITALSTVGSSRQKQVLRFAGAIFGGLVLGLGSQILILPWLDTIFGFTMLFGIVTLIAAWFATSGPRLSFFGVQMALAFYLVMFQSSGMAVSLLTSRDFAMGTLLGLVTMWLIFDRLWAKPAILEMKEAFADNMRYLGQLNQLSIESPSAIGKSDLLREQISGGFDKLTRNADLIVFEVGKHQAEHHYWRARLLELQSSQETLFLVQLALNHYRFHLSVAEWPLSLEQAFRRFNNELVSSWEDLAEQVLQIQAPGLHKQSMRKQLAELRHEAVSYFRAILDENDLHGLEAILDLDEQMVSTTEKLTQEVLNIT